MFNFAITFDSIWALESIQTHLEFFGGLKGLPRARQKEIAHAVATSVGLGDPEVYTRYAGALSGGMKRRLSIALLGASNVLLLDEPSKSATTASVKSFLVIYLTFLMNRLSYSHWT